MQRRFALLALLLAGCAAGLNQQNPIPRPPDPPKAPLRSPQPGAGQRNSIGQNVTRWIRVYTEVEASKFSYSPFAAWGQAAIGHQGRSQRLAPSSPTPGNGYAGPWYGDELLYIAPGEGQSGTGPAFTLLRPSDNLPPRRLTEEAVLSVAWGPEGSWGPDRTGVRVRERTLAYTTVRGSDFRLHLKRLDTGEVAELLPGGQRAFPSGAVLRVHGWISPEILSLEAETAPGVHQILLYDTNLRSLLPSPERPAGRFIWQSRRLAGQEVRSFWLWDQTERRYITPEGLPGKAQFFESWDTGEGRTALFTAWSDLPYARSAGRPALYRLDVDSGKVRKLADNAALAAWTWSGKDYLAYLRLGERLTLVLADGQGGGVLYEEDLGVPGVDDELEQYRPIFAGNFLFYRLPGNGLRVLHYGNLRGLDLHGGPLDQFAASGGGAMLALLAEGRLAVIPNPLYAMQTELREP